MKSLCSSSKINCLCTVRIVNDLLMVRILMYVQNALLFYWSVTQKCITVEKML